MICGISSGSSLFVIKLGVTCRDNVPILVVLCSVAV